MIESYQYPDYLLASNIGVKEGISYQNILDSMRRSRLNKNNKLDGFDEYLRPMINARL